MPRVEYSRDDCLLTILRHEDGSVSIRSPTLRVPELASDGLSPGELFRFRAPPGSIPSLHWLAGPLQRWHEKLPPDDARFDRMRLARVLIDVADPDLSALPWDAHIARRAPAGVQVVRVTRTRPRALAAALSLPIRIVDVNPSASQPLKPAISAIFGRIPKRKVALAVRVIEARLGSMPMTTVPVADVLHFTSLPTLSRSRTLMLTASPSGSVRSVGCYG